MKQYGVKESWTQVIELTPDIVPKLYNPMDYLRPLWILENGEILVDKVEKGLHLALYDPKEKEFKNVIDHDHYYGFESVIYRETLVSPAIGTNIPSKNMADCDGQFHRAFTDHEDILVEILTRLPVKSLMRFRCVCKPWRALISQSYFATKHRSYADTENSSSRLIFSTIPPTSIGLEELENFKDGLVTATKLHFPVITSAEKINLVGSCDGLICVEVNRGQFVLWNPCTGDSKVLPKPSFDCHSRFYGFGYDSTSGDYKLVIGYDFLDPIIQVFTLKSGSWRTYDGLYNDKLRGQGFFLNGALHWLELESMRIQGGSKIVSFHLGEEEFLEIPSPGDDYKAIWGSRFLTYRNSLCVFSGVFILCQFSICMMKEYGVKESWTEVIKLDSDTVPQSYDEIVYMRPLCILENGEILVNKVGKGPQLALYNPKEKAFRDVIDPHYHYKFESVIYRETLVSPAIGSDGDI